MKGDYLFPMVALGKGVFIRVDLIECVIPPHEAMAQACVIAYNNPPESLIIADGYKGPIPCMLSPDEVIRRIELARTELLFAQMQGPEAAAQRTKEEVQSDPQPRPKLNKTDTKNPPAWMKNDE